MANAKLDEMIRNSKLTRLVKSNAAILLRLAGIDTSIGLKANITDTDKINADLESIIQEVSMKRGISEKITSSDCDAALLESIAGTAAVIPPDRSVTVDKLDTVILRRTMNLLRDSNFVKGSIDVTTHIFTADEAGVLHSGKIYVKAGTRYYMHNNSGTLMGNCVVYQYASDDSYIRSDTIWAAGILMQASTSYVIINLSTINLEISNPIRFSEYVETGIYGYQVEDIQYKDDLTFEKLILKKILGTEITENAFNKIINLYDISSAEAVMGYALATNNGTASIAGSSNTSPFISVKDGEIFNTNLYGGTYCYYTESKKFISGATFNRDNTGEKPANFSLTIPPLLGIKYIRVSGNTAYPNIGQSAWYSYIPYIVKGEYIPAAEVAYGATSYVIKSEAITKIDERATVKATEVLIANGAVSPLYNKKWAYVGDSTSGYTTTPFPNIISTETGCILENRALSGWRMMRTAGNNCLLDKIDLLDGTEDYITILAGYNDRTDYVAGTMFSSGVTLNMDEATFYGAYNSAINKIITKCPNARIGVMTILPNGTERNNTASLAVNTIIKEVAAWWTIPCLDLYNEVQLPCWLDTINTNYYLGDRIHPNDAGHIIIARKIKRFLERL